MEYAVFALNGCTASREIFDMCPPVGARSPEVPLCQRQEQFFEFLRRHGRLVTVFPALLQPSGDNLEASPIQGLGDRRQLSDDLAAAAVVFDHVDDAVELPPRPLQAHENVAANRWIYLHDPMLPQYPLGYCLEHGT